MYKPKQETTNETARRNGARMIELLVNGIININSAFHLPVAKQYQGFNHCTAETPQYEYSCRYEARITPPVVVVAR